MKVLWCFNSVERLLKKKKKSKKRKESCLENVNSCHFHKRQKWKRQTNIYFKSALWWAAIIITGGHLKPTTERLYKIKRSAIALLIICYNVTEQLAIWPLLLTHTAHTSTCWRMELQYVIFKQGSCFWYVFVTTYFSFRDCPKYSAALSSINRKEFLSGFVT